MDLIVYRTDTESLIKRKPLSVLLQRLPDSLHSRALRYKSAVSAYNFVVGRLLLKRGLEDFGLDIGLEQIEIQKNGKPVIAGIYFNISHSDHQVICGFSEETQFGVDLEKITAVDFEDFTTMFTTKEWLVIKGADQPLRSFYWFWTRKESIIKALGLKLSYLHQIELDITSDELIIDGKHLFLRDLDLGENYVGAVCTERRIGTIQMVEVTY